MSSTSASCSLFISGPALHTPKRLWNYFMSICDIMWEQHLKTEGKKSTSVALSYHPTWSRCATLFVRHCNLVNKCLAQHEHLIWQFCTSQVSECTSVIYIWRFADSFLFSVIFSVCRRCCRDIRAWPDTRAFLVSLSASYGSPIEMDIHSRPLTGTWSCVKEVLKLFLSSLSGVLHISCQMSLV